MAEKKLFLLDGHALVYRAHYAFIQRPLINSKGFNTSAITGFVRTLWDLIQNQKPTHLAVSFDLEGPTFRHEMFPEYKANREAQPEDISASFPYLRQILDGFKIPIVEVEGYEADDVIGTLSKQAEQEGFDVYMVTPDKDYGQLVSDKVFLYKPARMGNGIEIQGVPEILAKWNIERVEQVIDMLGLQGDSVDNIPGIPGIGAKTAAKLLAQYDSMEGIFENVEELKGKMKERVIEFEDQGRLSKVLATIKLDVPIQFDAARYLIEPLDKDALSVVFKELEFRTLARQILGEAAAPAPGQQGQLFGEASAPRPSAKAPAKHSVATKNITNTAHQYHSVDTAAQRQDLVKLLEQQNVICFDTETTGIDANEASLVGLAFAVKAGEAYYVPVPEDEKEAQAIVEDFKGVLENESIKKIAQNAKYDLLILKWYGVEVKGSILDTMIAHYLLEPELRHNMDFLAETYLQYQPVSIETLIGKRGKNQLTMRDVPVAKVVEYAGEDADITFQLQDKLFPELKEEKLDELYFSMEEPLVHALVEMEYNGIRVDTDYLAAYSEELGKQVRAAEQEIYDDSGHRFNIASPKQVGQVLFDHMKIPYRWKKTASGQYSTNEEKLNDLAADHPIVNKFL